MGAIRIAAVTMFLVLCGCRRTHDANPKENVELLRLLEEDQADRSGAALPRINWSEVNARDVQRRQRVGGLLDGGAAKVSADYLNAATVFQHGSDVQDYRLARELALKAAELDPANQEARWMAAAAKDRELMSLGKPQLYGTQFRKQGTRWVLYDVDPMITDEERDKWNVPALEAMKARAEEMNAAE